LDEIIASDGVEIGVEVLDRERGRWHFDHHAKGRRPRLAASRDEPELEDLSGPSRAVLGLIRRVVDVARQKGRGVSLCGDLAADPTHVSLLLDHGLRELSVSPSALRAVKAAIARYHPDA